MTDEQSSAAATPQTDLSWIPAAGGPQVKCEDGRHVTGLPESGWWVWVDQTHRDRSAGLELNLHTAWDEPETGAGGTLITTMKPADGGVA